MSRGRFPWYVLLLILLSLAVIASDAGAVTASPSRASVEPGLLKALAEGGQATFIVYLREQADLGLALQIEDKLARRREVVALLQATAERSQRPVRDLLLALQAGQHVSAVQPLWITNALVVSGDAEAVKALAERPEVARIRSDHVHQLPAPLPAASSLATWNLRLIGAQRVWEELGITGKGVVVASLDSGVDWTHPALRGAYRGGPAGQHDYNWFDFTRTYPLAPGDGHGHGTHTMGIMVGYDPAASLHIGVAPGARWISAKVFDDDGYTSDSILHQGFQWMLAPTDLRGQHPDPRRAPDVVNCSWGAVNPADPTFWDDVAALRAAGILPVFSAGNEGELGAGSVGTPAGFPHSFSVGALDANELLPEWSSRGPSYWGEIKPEVTAPGVDVLSSVPGADYEPWSGTSMAAPHAAGTAALLLEADPSLTVEDLEAFITGTAYDLGTPGPDNDYGAGRLDAYAAVAWALGAGKLTGRVVAADTGLPLPQAQVTGVQEVTGHAFRTASDQSGAYNVSAPAGRYRVTAVAFGYAGQSYDDVEVVDGYRALRDFKLQPLPKGTVSGRLREPGGGGVGLGQVRAEGTPAETAADPSGVYTLTLPAGTYTLTATSPGYRLARAVVTVAAGQTTEQDLVLAPAPRLLLIDADGWVGDNITVYYRDALTQAGYLFDTRRITDTALVPTAAELAPYDVVIWANPWSSPGYFERERGDTAVVDALAGYLLGGGRLLLTGQDIGYWDSGEEYYTDLLHARYLTDSAASEGVHGLAEEILAGVELSFSAVDAYRLETAPDLIEPADVLAVPVMGYDQPGRTAGLRVEDRGYRLAYLAFGLEKAGPGSERAQALEQALAWLAAPAVEKRMLPAHVMPGDRLRVLLNLHNPLGIAQPVSLWDPLPAGLTYVEGSATAGATYDPAANAIRWLGELPPRADVTVAFTASVSTGMPGGTVVENCAWLENISGAVTKSCATARVEGPNLAASEKRVVPATVAAGEMLTYTIALRNSGLMPADLVTLLDPLPAQVFLVERSITGGAWYNPVARQIEWSGSLPAGLPGRPDYTWADSDMPGGPAFAWVDISGRGVPLALGDDQWVGPFPLGFAFPFYGQSFTEFYVSSNGWLSFSRPASSQPGNQRLPSPSAPGNLVALFWDDLNPGRGGVVRYLAEGGRLVVSYEGVPRFGSGGPYTFEGILSADGVITVQYKRMEGTRLSEATVGIQNADGSRGVTVVHDAPYVHDNLGLRFLPPQPDQPSEHIVSFQARVAGDVPDNTPVVNHAFITADGLAYTRTVTATVQAADLTPSYKEVSEAIAIAGSTVAYTITLHNAGSGMAQVTVRDPLPGGVQFVEGSAMGGAFYNPGSNEVAWEGSLAPGETRALGFAARVASNLATGTRITNTAIIADGVHPPLTRSATTMVAALDFSRSRKDADRAWAIAGEVLTYTLTLLNQGAATATGVSLIDPLPPELSILPDTLQGGATYDPETRAVHWHGSLPPLSEDYSWMDSDMPRGPAFAWVDISGSGVPLTLGDDQWVGPLPLGFAFPFYGQSFTEFYVSSNGWLSFSRPTSSQPGNQRLPSPSAPGNLVALFWDDLNPGRGGVVRYLAEGGRLVVSYEGVPRFGTGESYTFEGILSPDGVITVQYKRMEGARLNEATVGIQNADGSRGVTVVHNAPYVHDNLALRFLPPRPLEITFQARLAPDLPPDTVITNTAYLTHPFAQPQTLSAVVRVNRIDLSSSSVSAEPAVIRPGQPVTCTVTLRNTGNVPSSAGARITVPLGTTYLPDSAWGGAIYDEASGQVRWQGEVPAGSEASFGFTALSRRPLPDRTLLTCTAVIEDGVHPAFERSASATVAAPDLSLSRKEGHAPWVMAGDVLTYTVEVRNDGSAQAEVTFEDPLPEGTEYVSGSAWAGSGGSLVYEEAIRSLQWQGSVPGKSIAILRFALRPLTGGLLTNTATLEDGFGVVTEMSTATEVRWPYEHLLPLILR